MEQAGWKSRLRFRREKGLPVHLGDLVESSRKQTRLIERVSKENERLLRNMLPRRIAQQVKHGDEDLVETVPDVSVLFVEIRGLIEVTRERSTTESIEILKRIIAVADSVGEKHGVERLKSMGDTFMAVVGLSTPVLDHMRRAVEFASEMRDAAERIGKEYDLDLSVGQGIGAGPVVTDVLHDEELLFYLWGDPVIQAKYAMDRAANGQIVVTQTLYDKLEDNYRFVRVPGEDSIPLWALA